MYVGKCIYVSKSMHVCKSMYVDKSMYDSKSMFVGKCMYVGKSMNVGKRIYVGMDMYVGVSWRHLRDFARACGCVLRSCVFLLPTTCFSSLPLSLILLLQFSSLSQYSNYHVRSI